MIRRAVIPFVVFILFSCNSFKEYVDSGELKYITINDEYFDSVNKVFDWKINSRLYEFENLSFRHKYKDKDIEIFIERGKLCLIRVGNQETIGAFLFTDNQYKSFIKFGNVYNKDDINDLYIRYNIKDSNLILKKIIKKIYWTKKVESKDYEKVIDECISKYIKVLYQKTIGEKVYLLNPKVKTLTLNYNNDIVLEPYGELKGSDKNLFLFLSLDSNDFVSKLLEQNHFRFYDKMDGYKVYYSPAVPISRIEDKIGKMRENRIKVEKILRINDQSLIHCYYFKDDNESYNLIFEKLGFALPKSSSIFQRDNQSIGHEINHVLLYRAFGWSNSDFLDEGFATLYDGNNNDHHQMTSEILKKDSASLKDLRNGKYFYRNAQDINYPVAASFVRYFIEKYGVEKFGALWKSEEFAKHFKEITGEDFNLFVNGWLELVL